MSSKQSLANKLSVRLSYYRSVTNYVHIYSEPSTDHYICVYHYFI